MPTDILSAPIPSTHEAARPGAGRLISRIAEFTGRLGLPPRYLLALLAVTCLGAFLRCYRLGEQSVWLDEFLSLTNLSASSPASMLRFLKTYSPEQGQCPLYYIMLYYWCQLFGSAVVTVRLLTVAIGTLSIPLLFWLFRSLHGNRVAMAGCLCYAMSPQHVWHAQEPRPYTLITPLVIIAIYALFRAVDGGKWWWWALNLVMNAVLVWVHLLMVLFILVQGLFMLVSARHFFRTMMVWGVLQLLLLAPWTYWMLRMPFVTELSGGASLSEIGYELFLDDIVSVHTDILPPFKTNPPEYWSPLERQLLPFHFTLDRFLGVTIVAGALVLLVTWVWPKVFFGDKGSDVILRARQRASFWLVLIVVPGSVLGMLAMALQVPLVGPMYAMYNTLGLYAGVGILLSLAPWRPLFVAGTAVVAGLYSYQLALVLPEATRANWMAAGKEIAAHAGPADKVVEIEFFAPTDMLRFNWPERGIPSERVWTIEAAIDDAAEYLGESHLGNDTRISTWIIYEEHLLSMVCPEPAGVIEAALTRRNLSFERKRFPGHYNVELIRVWRSGEALPSHLEEPVPMNAALDYDTVVRELHLESTDRQTTEQRKETLRHFVPIWPPLLRFFTFSQAASMLAAGRLDESRALSHWGVSTAPEFGLAHFVEGLLFAIENSPLARSAFDSAYEHHPGLESVFKNYVDSLLTDEGCDECLAQLHKLQQEGFISYEAALEAACRLRNGCPADNGTL